MKVSFPGKILIASVAGLCLLGGRPQMASAINGVCVNCHTMHDSQNNLPMATGGPVAQLLTANNCIACHTGTNDATHKYYVNSNADPTAVMLAGGSFYWADNSHGGDYNTTKGHNLSYLNGGAADPNLATAPGGTLASPITCAGTTGCHGVRTVAGDAASVAGSHHGNTNGAITAPTLGTPGTGFRFLDGIQGYEDSNREYVPTLTATQHNQYKGVDRAQSTTNTNSTISYLCGECHGDFHHGGAGTIASGGTAMSSPWVRHPTDFDIFNVILKSDYAGMASGAGTYDTLTPVASTDVSAILTTFKPTGAGTAIVTCISCHRAHGSANADLLRWDYTTCVAGTPNVACGCFHCHTAKD